MFTSSRRVTFFLCCWILPQGRNGFLMSETVRDDDENTYLSVYLFVVVRTPEAPELVKS